MQTTLGLAADHRDHLLSLSSAGVIGLFREVSNDLRLEKRRTPETLSMREGSTIQGLNYVVQDRE